MIGSINKTILVAKKHLVSETEKAYVFYPYSRYKDIFSIPKSQIISKDESVIPVNEVYNEPAFKLVLTSFIFDRIKPHLDSMSKFAYFQLVK